MQRGSWGPWLSPGQAPGTAPNWFIGWFTCSAGRMPGGIQSGVHGGGSVEVNLSLAGHQVPGGFHLHLPSAVACRLSAALCFPYMYILAPSGTAVRTQGVGCRFLSGESVFLYAKHNKSGFLGAEAKTAWMVHRSYGCTGGAVLPQHWTDTADTAEDEEEAPGRYF